MDKIKVTHIYLRSPLWNINRPKNASLVQQQLSFEYQKQLTFILNDKRVLLLVRNAEENVQQVWDVFIHLDVCFLVFCKVQCCLLLLQFAIL